MKYLWRALGYLKNYWLLATGAFLGLIMSSGARLVVPRLTQVIIDDGIAAGRMDVIVQAAAGMVGVAIGGS
ncbi:MAG: ABC transporter ATP-binding protein, partial [Chloroflexota bacterium]|nr:ABC transporter ATP-binding protein [Chloroflexota bacterium]